MRIGTRGSALALTQAGYVADRLRSSQLGGAEIVTLSTSGDRAGNDTTGGNAAGSGAQSSGAPADKSRWVDTIEQALLAGEIDLAVHSAKDVPGELAEGLVLLGAPARVSAEDVLCGAPSLQALADGAHASAPAACAVRRSCARHARICG